MDEQKKSVLNTLDEFQPLGIIPLQGAKELGEKINEHLIAWYERENPEELNAGHKDGWLIDVKCPRFSSGDAKAVLSTTVRGPDLYLIIDVGNYNCKYQMFGQTVPMSPDDHYADLKRVISAISGKAERLTVIMPILYGGRQHKRSARESLDCAMALQELENMGVKNIVTFDAHDPRVQNACPLMGIDNAMPTYQVLKALFKNVRDLQIDKDHLMVVSPDEGAMNRNMYYSSVLGTDLGMFYKRRDYSIIVNGRNPIVAHEYLGTSVKGKDILVADDIIASGDSMLTLAEDLKKEGARRIFMTVTYGLFTEGVEKFQKAYNEGLFDGILTTNLTYRCPELLNAPWYIEVDMSKYIAYFILAFHQNKSITKLLDPHKKIKDLLDRYRAAQK